MNRYERAALVARLDWWQKKFLGIRHDLFQFFVDLETARRELKEVRNALARNICPQSD